MKTTGFYLGWIVVNDLKKAVKFYTEIVGLKVKTLNEEWKWAELEGHEGGASLGIGEMRGHRDVVKPGDNTIPTFAVQDINKAIAEYKSKNAKLIGDVEEVPGHVKMQMIQDEDGNHFQIVELLSQ